jgi:flavin reductase ActVB
MAVANVATKQPAADLPLFKDALAEFPAAVVLVTTTGADHVWKGFTASSFCGVSLRPPIVTACLYEAAECYTSFLAVTRFCVSFLHGNHTDLATRFATRGADKFRGEPFATDRHGVPYLADANRSLSCELLSTSTVGDHEVLFGRVDEVRTPGEQLPPLLYWRRGYAEITPRDSRLKRGT